MPYTFLHVGFGMHNLECDHGSAKAIKPVLRCKLFYSKLSIKSVMDTKHIIILL